jgi:hypothetical protein
MKRSCISNVFYQPISSYTISMDNTTPCPSPETGYAGTYNSRRGVRVHFQHRHWQDFIQILEEGILPKCKRCLLFTSNAGSEQHQNSAARATGTRQHLRRLQQLTNKIGEITSISIKGTTIKPVPWKDHHCNRRQLLSHLI